MDNNQFISLNSSLKLNNNQYIIRKGHLNNYLEVYIKTLDDQITNKKNDIIESNLILIHKFIFNFSICCFDATFNIDNIYITIGLSNGHISHIHLLSKHLVINSQLKDNSDEDELELDFNSLDELLSNHSSHLSSLSSNDFNVIYSFDNELEDINISIIKHLSKYIVLSCNGNSILLPYHYDNNQISFTDHINLNIEDNVNISSILEFTTSDFNHQDIEKLYKYNEIIDYNEDEINILLNECKTRRDSLISKLCSDHINESFRGSIIFVGCSDGSIQYFLSPNDNYNIDISIVLFKYKSSSQYSIQSMFLSNMHPNLSFCQSLPSLSSVNSLPQKESDLIIAPLVTHLCILEGGILTCIGIKLIGGMIIGEELLINLKSSREICQEFNTNQNNSNYNNNIKQIYYLDDGIISWKNNRSNGILFYLYNDNFYGIPLSVNNNNNLLNQLSNENKIYDYISSIGRKIYLLSNPSSIGIKYFNIIQNSFENINILLIPDNNEKNLINIISKLQYNNNNNNNNNNNDLLLNIQSILANYSNTDKKKKSKNDKLTNSIKYLISNMNDAVKEEGYIRSKITAVDLEILQLSSLISIIENSDKYKKDKFYSFRNLNDDSNNVFEKNIRSSRSLYINNDNKTYLHGYWKGLINITPILNNNYNLNSNNKTSYMDVTIEVYNETIMKALYGRIITISINSASKYSSSCINDNNITTYSSSIIFSKSKTNDNKYSCYLNFPVTISKISKYYIEMNLNIIYINPEINSIIESNTNKESSLISLLPLNKGIHTMGVSPSATSNQCGCALSLFSGEISYKEILSCLGTEQSYDENFLINSMKNINNNNNNNNNNSNNINNNTYNNENNLSHINMSIPQIINENSTNIADNIIDNIVNETLNNLKLSLLTSSNDFDECNRRSANGFKNYNDGIIKMIKPKFIDDKTNERSVNDGAKSLGDSTNLYIKHSKHLSNSAINYDACDVISLNSNYSPLLPSIHAITRDVVLNEINQIKDISKINDYAEEDIASMSYIDSDIYSMPAELQKIMFNCAVITREATNRNIPSSNSSSSSSSSKKNNIKSNFDIEQVTNSSNQCNNTTAIEDEMEVNGNFNDEDEVSEDNVLKKTAIKLFDLYNKLRDIGC